MDKIDRSEYELYLSMNPLVAEILDQLDELVEESNDLRKAYHAEMNALAGLVNGLEERIEKLENTSKAD